MRVHRQISQLIIVNSFFMLALNMFAPLYALFIQGISPDVIQIGGVWAFFTFSTGILTFLLSRFENHFKNTGQFLVIGFLARAIGWTGYLFADSLWQIYLIQIVLALGEACGSPSYNALFSRYLDKGKFVSEWGLHSGVNYMIIGVAAFAGSLVVDAFGFKALFIIMIVLSLASVVLTLNYSKSFNSKKK